MEILMTAAALSAVSRVPGVRRRRRGLALIEVLVCVSICAMMLTATAIAFRASVGAYRDNTDRNLLISHGRIAMRQLINEIRQADAHGPINDSLIPNATTLFSQGQTIENTGIQMLKNQPDADEPGIIPGNSATYVLITWQYDAANRQITRTRSLNGINPVTNVVAMYVQDFKVRMEPARSAANIASGNTAFDLLLRAVVSIKLQDVDSTGKIMYNQGNGLVTESIIDAAVPRKNFSGL
jgi:type II secretory pathway component PulJ